MQVTLPYTFSITVDLPAKSLGYLDDGVVDTLLASRLMRLEVTHGLMKITQELAAILDSCYARVLAIDKKPRGTRKGSLLMDFSGKFCTFLT